MRGNVKKPRNSDRFNFIETGIPIENYWKLSIVFDLDRSSISFSQAMNSHLVTIGTLATESIHIDLTY